MADRPVFLHAAVYDDIADAEAGAIVGGTDAAG